MEKGKLTKLLENFTIDQNLSAELYFVIKNSDNVYELYSTIPDQKLIKEMIKSYTDELSKFSNEHTPYELHSIYNDNENQWNYLYFDALNSTKISSEVFNADVTKSSPYTTEIGDYGSIFGFVIDIYNGNKDEVVRIFKKALPTQAMRTSRVFGISVGEDGKFKSMEKDAVFFQKNVDLFKIGNELIIKSYDVYENSFKFDEILKRRVQDSLKILLKIPGLDFTPAAIEHISNLNNTKRKKLINCVTNNKIISEENTKPLQDKAKNI